MDRSRRDGVPEHDESTARRDRFEGLFNAESRALLGYALRRTQRAEDAADVVAETFLVAWRRIDDVPLGSEARLWLYGVARRFCANQARHLRRTNRLAERLREELAFQLSRPAEPETDTALLVREALQRLNEDDRELIQLTSWEGLSPTELATALSIPPATVRSRLHRARSRLRKELHAMGWAGERGVESGHVGGDGRVPVRQKEEL